MSGYPEIGAATILNKRQDDTKMQTPVSNVAQAVAETKAKKGLRPKNSYIERFPLRVHSAITIPMDAALKRLTGGHSLFTESDILRMALHSYLLANDPHYVDVMRGNGQA
jgi:hypothetical protein